ncbi:MAG: NAD(P)H-dependent oxidoreductase [Saprospiraceae bacterium]|nr:NAD(P)H-dependent oxidoreductase [Saprospiraceae bacterium]
MKKILAFGASSSKASINQQFAIYVARQIKEAEVIEVDLNDYEMPIYSVDRQRENGIHPLALSFKELLKSCDGLVISFAEHNGAYSTAFKNIFDWISRIDKNVWEEKPMLILSTAPGSRGGATVFGIAHAKFTRMNPNTVKGVSLPFFHKNFSKEVGVLDTELAEVLKGSIHDFEHMLTDQVG